MTPAKKSKADDSERIVATVFDGEPETWDRLAAAVGGGFFQCHAYARFAARHLNVQPILWRLHDEAGNCKGVSVGSINTPSGWPFSRYCRVLTLGALPATESRTAAAQRSALEAIETAARQMGVYRIQVSAFDSRLSEEVLSQLGYELLPRVEFYIDLRLPEDALLANLKGVRRNDLRRAMRNGVATREQVNIESYELLIRFELFSLARHGVSSPVDVRTEAAAVKNRFGDSRRGRLFVSYKDGEPLSAALFGVFGRSAYYVYSGSSEPGNRHAAPAQLIWTAIQTFRNEGIDELNLGGVKTPTDENDPNYGLYRFKRNFGSDVVSQSAGEKILSTSGARLAHLRSAIKQIGVR